MDEPFIGQIQLFTYNFTPRGWALCDGTTLSIAQNTALYSLIGCQFGGNGTTTFMLPDLRNANPLASTNQMRYFIALEGYYPQQS